MSKIEIHDLQELIHQNYPQEMVEKLIQQVLILSLKVKKDYPDYKSWFLTTQVPGLYDNTRNIIIAHIKDKIVGFISLKKTKEEKKICTFYVEKNFRRNKIGTILVERAINYLEDEKPLITIPFNKLNEFTRIGEKLSWEITDIRENMYRADIPEVIVNGNVSETSSNIVLPDSNKSLKKIYRKYRIERLKMLIIKSKIEIKSFV